MATLDWKNLQHIIAATDVTKECTSDTVTELKRIHNIPSSTSAQTIDVGVSVDGTWQRRGFNGVVTAISIDTGKVVDVEIMSKICKHKEYLKNTDPLAYANWRNSHYCSSNYSGSAPGMEPEGAKRIFQRSIDDKNLRYTKFLGDGDSKSFSSIKDIYDGTTVETLECIWHYQ